MSSAYIEGTLSQVSGTYPWEYPDYDHNTSWQPHLSR